MKVKCENCGKEFEKLPSAIKRTKHNFCCRECAGIFNGKRRSGPYNIHKYGKDTYEKAIELRKQNNGYRTISAILNVPWPTLRGWLKDIKSDKEKAHRKGVESKMKPIHELKRTVHIRNRLIKIRGHQCEKCKNKTWFGKPIWLEAHHIDGNKKNNKEENFELLCLNCHALTDNYRNKGGVAKLDETHES